MSIGGIVIDRVRSGADKDSGRSKLVIGKGEEQQSKSSF